MRRRLIAAGVASYALALLVMAPASLQDALLDKVSEGRLRIAAAHGSIWSGAGQIEIRDGRRALVAKDMAWRLLPAYLLRGQLRAEIGLDQRDKPFILSASLSGIEISNADIELPARVLISGVSKLAALGVTGNVNLRIPHLEVSRTGMTGDAKLEWRSAGSELSRVSPLGDYELSLHGEGAAINANLLTLKGPLQLEGQASWAFGEHPVFQATARIPPGQTPQLAPLLRLIAIERGDGSFVLQLK